MEQVTKVAELSEKKLSEKWGVAINPGFVAIPNMLLMHQGRIGLTDGELVTLQHLLMAWWRGDERPFVRPETIAKRTGASPRTVQRHVRSLEGLGLIRRINATRREPVKYDLGGTLAKLTALAKANPPKPASDTVQEELHQTEAPF
ncbi:helix-turn-helix protein [Panacagrimonas perspica]|uniref:Helix-turn-helix protein n=1 Tax=Panacagrimonas perspica TaxID=381431 RepID=A0A4S3JZB6_9GAMM|nr:helix-turn-helix domain-containing protein [Panacagrimonas perspica]TDU32839.1 helix-turn-helix protein [Panacagrimonas perspica]THD00955.1 hypothetical protein B1810_22105 [Panacagrimonas perspica]